MNKKVVYILTLVTLVALVGVSLARQPNDHRDNVATKITASAKASIEAFENLYKLFLERSLPSSLDQVYQEARPERVGNVYLGEMFKMVGLFEGIAINVQQGDWTNAETSFNAFSTEYNNVSKMVPEWRQYFDKNLVTKIGKDIDNQDVNKTFEDIGTLGEKCDNCHRDKKPQVWMKYYWRDFRTVNITTPNGNMSWPAGMEFIATALDGTLINLLEGKKDQANENAETFKAMFPPKLKEACNQCHDSERKYFVTDDVATIVDQYVSATKAGDIQKVQTLQSQIGEQCMKCHIVHQTQQKMKEMMDQKIN